MQIINESPSRTFYVTAGILLLLLIGLMLAYPPRAPAQEAQPCMIVKHKGTVGRRLIFTALIGVPIAPGAKYDLVDAVNLKPGLSSVHYKVAFKGKELQEMKAQGTRIIVLEKKYTSEDLAAARKVCESLIKPKADDSNALHSP